MLRDEVVVSGNECNEKGGVLGCQWEGCEGRGSEGDVRPGVIGYGVIVRVCG